MEVVLNMLFFSLSNIDIKFAKLEKLIWRFYTATETWFTTSWVKLIDKRKFAKTTLNENSKSFMIYTVALEAAEIAEMTIHLS